MCSLFGSLCQALGAGAVVGGPTIHIRAHRRRIGFSTPSKGTPEQKSEAGSAVMTTIHGLSQREWEPRLRIFTDDFPREMMRMLTEKLGCRGSVVEDPVSGPVVYLEGDRRSIIGTWLAYGQDGPWINSARIRIHRAIDEEWGFKDRRSWRDRCPWIRKR